jgi:hypothetical protein
VLQPIPGGCQGSPNPPVVDRGVISCKGDVVRVEKIPAFERIRREVGDQIAQEPAAKLFGLKPEKNFRIWVYL